MPAGFKGGLGGDRFERIVEGELKQRRARKEQRGANDRRVLLEAYGVEALNSELEGKIDGVVGQLKAHGSKLESGELAGPEAGRSFDVLEKPFLNTHAIRAYRETLKDGGADVSDEDLVANLYKGYADDSSVAGAGSIRWARNPLKAFDAMKSSDQRKKAAQRIGALNAVLSRGGSAGFEKTPAFEDLDRRAFDEGYRVFSTHVGPFVTLKAQPMTELEGLVRAELERREEHEKAREAGAVGLSPEEQKIAELQRKLDVRDTQIEAVNAEKAREAALHGQINELVLKLVPILAQNGGAELVPEVRKLIEQLKQTGAPVAPAGLEQAA